MRYTTQNNTSLFNVLPVFSSFSKELSKGSNLDYYANFCYEDLAMFEHNYELKIEGHEETTDISELVFNRGGTNTVGIRKLKLSIHLFHMCILKIPSICSWEFYRFSFIRNSLSLWFARLGKVSSGIVNSISVEDVGSKNIKELLMKDTKDTKKNYSYDAEFFVELNALPYRLTNFDEYCDEAIVMSVAMSISFPPFILHIVKQAQDHLKATNFFLAIKLNLKNKMEAVANIGLVQDQIQLEKDPTIEEGLGKRVKKVPV
ncbi:uncharacterized protein G2W53_014177 [Senna tora]|uniref:Uncharacterized protein n=1 Tax=Senna tora TaxID=362788 RepID=A0A834WT36_9FABA|nr:uncharacterized protein G2W53_014177 [Senna tora]